MNYFLYNGSLQYQYAFDDVESIFSSRTLLPDRMYIIVSSFSFDAFKLDNFDFSQHLLVFNSPTEVLVPFLQQLLELCSC